MKENNIPARPVDLLFPDRREAIAEGRCIQVPMGCGEDFSMSEFRDELSQKEYRISGFCQKCQDSVFGK